MNKIKLKGKIMPLATNENLKNQIENKINLLSQIATINKALILTETDLQCQLYMKLNEIEELNQLSLTNDGFMTNKIHTEISWFDEQNILSIRPDITLLESENLKITSGFDGLRLPSKGFHSVDGGIIFELKFDRELNTISEQKTMEGIFKDIRNFKLIYDRFQNNGTAEQIYGYFVLFIKSSENHINMQKINRIQNELVDRDLDETKCKFIYHFIGVN